MVQRRTARRGVVAALISVLLCATLATAAFALEDTWSGSVNGGVRLYQSGSYYGWRWIHGNVDYPPGTYHICTKGVTASGTIRNGTNPCTYNSSGLAISNESCFPVGEAMRAYVYHGSEWVRTTHGRANTTTICN